MQISTFIQDNLIFFLVGIVLLIIIIKLVTAKIAKNKATLTLTTEAKTIALGETVSGNLLIEPLEKLDIYSIDISITATASQPDHSDRSTNRAPKKLYKDTFQASRNVQLEKAQSSEFYFSFALPSFQENIELANRIKHFAQEGASIQWSLKAKVKCKGIDLSCSKRLVFIQKNLS